MSNFKNKSVLVLGGSRGIGAAIVRRFAADGAKVAFTYSGSPEAAHALATETGANDYLTDSADRDAVIARVRDSGPLDILIVNSGIAIFGDALPISPPTRLTGCSASMCKRLTTPRWRRRDRCLTADGLS